MRTGIIATSLSLALLTFVPATAPAGVEGPPAGTWRLDPERSVVQFTVTKLGFEDVTGVFRDFSGVVRYDPASPVESSVEWSVKVSSVKTDASNRDRSLQSAEYFESARHPEMTFRSERVRPLGDGRLQVEGPITIKGRSRPLTILVVPSQRGFETSFELNRYDFDIVGGSVMGRLIGRTVRVKLLAIAAASTTLATQVR
jgi:polyisoprenoid-binding protein YceI